MSMDANSNRLQRSSSQGTVESVPERPDRRTSFSKLQLFRRGQLSKPDFAFSSQTSPSTPALTTDMLTAYDDDLDPLSSGEYPVSPGNAYSRGDTDEEPTSPVATSERKPSKSSIVPRLRHALSTVHLPTLGGSSTGLGKGSSKKRVSEDNATFKEREGYAPSSATFERVPTISSLPDRDSSGGSNQSYANYSNASGYYNFSVPQNYNSGNNKSLSVSDDYRRPSYASQTTQSSSMSRRSQNDGLMMGSGSDSPSNGQVSLPMSLDPSELSLITNMNPAYYDQKQYPGGKGVAYPDPETVLDTKSMYEQQKAAAAAVAAKTEESYANSLRSESVSSYNLSGEDGQKGGRKHKRSFFGKLMPRRESSADFHASKQQPLKGLKHKGSETFLPLRSFSSTTQFSKAPGTGPPSIKPYARHKSSLAYEYQSPSRSNTSSPQQSTAPPQGRERSKSTSTPAPKPLPPIPQMSSFNNGEGPMYMLDTNLDEMQGIIQSPDSSRPDRQPNDRINDLTNETTTTQIDNDNDPKMKKQRISLDGKFTTQPPQNEATNINNDRIGTPPTRPRPMSTQSDTVAEEMQRAAANVSAINVAETGWMAPESWRVATPMVPETKLQEQPSTVAPEKAPAKKQVAERHCLRVFREDGTFGTLSCDMNITVEELVQMLGRKFFMSATAGYQLSVRTSGLTRVMDKNEHPLQYQKRMLISMGYTDSDRLGDVGREDLSYLCRFVFSRQELRKFSDEEFAVMSRDFTHVNLQKMSLETIPIVFYQHCSDIEVLDVSKNPSVEIPLDFIQACVNLRRLRYVENQARQFPPNIKKAPRLTALDMSNNLLDELDHVFFDDLKKLTYLNLQGNRLVTVPANIAILSSLRRLNLSSNNLTHLPNEICDITTLNDLDVSFNHLQGLPSRIGQLSQLERLLLTNNDIAQRLPDSFRRLVSLKELDIRYNKLQNIDILSELPKLEVLYCSKNLVYLFKDTFPRLKVFYFDRNPITRISFAETHYTLAVLNLSKAKITSLSENFLEKIPMVEKLVLDKNHLLSLPPQIANLKRLTFLSLFSNQLASLPNEIGELKELRWLDVHSNNLKSLPDAIWDLTSLTVLNASSNLLDAFPKPTYRTGSLAGSETSIGGKSDVQLDSNYQMRLNDKRRASELSAASTASPKEARRAGMYPGRELSDSPHSSSSESFAGSPNTIYPSYKKHSIPSVQSGSGGELELPLPKSRGLADTLLVLSLGDNRLGDECFEYISQIRTLEVLNLSYNELMEIPAGALGMLTQLTELYLSGNRLSGLPADDFEFNQALRVFHVNGNKLHTLPAELGKMPHLTTLDVGSNNLRYNINNWPYDWNWFYNRNLKYLNFSGNQKLEIKTVHSQGARDIGERNLSDFTVLQDIRVLGLMDVTLTTPSVPDQTENCRVRTYGSSVLQMSYGMADAIGRRENLGIMDMVVERFRSNEKEAIIGLFDGRNQRDDDGNKVAKLIQETFVNVFSESLKGLREGETTADALRRAFLNTNKEIGNTSMLPQDEIAHTAIAHRSSTAANLNPQDRMTGSCATIVYINDNKIYVANVGDSMAIMSKGIGEYTVLTTRHDPTSQDELARIRRGAGVVSSNGKLDGILDVSRAIGFYNLIPHIHAAPSIFSYELTGSEDFLILASKQLWEYVSYEIAADVARTHIRSPMLAAQKLRDFAIAYGCTDKIMVMVLGIGVQNKKSTMILPVISAKGELNPASVAYGPLPGAEEELFPALKQRKNKSSLPEDSALARLGEEIDPPIGNVAMVFTDIKNSTELWETYPVAMRSAIRMHNTLMRRTLRLARGYEVKTEGDAFIVSFSDPTSALMWCLSVQEMLLSVEWPEEIINSHQGCKIVDEESGELLFGGLSVRMGIHWGTPVWERDVITRRMDYFGPMVNRTARISSEADGGQVTLSTDFLMEMKRLEKAHDKVKDGLSLVDAYGDETIGAALEKNFKTLSEVGWTIYELGEKKLKGVENPENISCVYPKRLVKRFEFHQAAAEEKSKAQTQVQPAHPVQHRADQGATPVLSLVPSSPRRIGNITLQSIIQMRAVASRLEKICSWMNGSQEGYPERDQFMSFNRKTERQFASGVPNTDKDYLQFFEHMITRIENCVSTMYLRMVMGQLDPRIGGSEFNCQIGELLNALRGFMQIPEEGARQSNGNANDNN
ncbi:adenylate cyclase [Trichomonascus vanleenenianus]|uniref:adenylate cyclase n=1 Tax=Trichomonascus vanleenenianus TaxID=2268995 RepID=UPI003ECA8784